MTSELEFDRSSRPTPDYVKSAYSYSQGLKFVSTLLFFSAAFLPMVMWMVPSLAVNMANKQPSRSVPLTLPSENGKAEAIRMELTRERTDLAPLWGLLALWLMIVVYYEFLIVFLLLVWSWADHIQVVAYQAKSNIGR